MNDQTDLPFETDEDVGRSQERAVKIERARTKLLRRLAAAAPQTVRERVAWILNHVPTTRNTDVELCIEYWKRFNPEYIDGDSVRLRNLYEMDRVPAIVRERQRIQNDYRLFLATAEVRARRGTLSEEERQRAIDEREPPPPYTVYADESGKGGDFVVTGAAWSLDSYGLLRLTREIEEHRTEHGFSSELHFKEVDRRNLDFYLGVADLVVQSVAAISFTSVSVPRRGVSRIDDALAELWFHLLIKGVEHHNDTGRAILPRSLNFFKDEEEPGRDAILVATLRERLMQVSRTRFEGQLVIDRMSAHDSAGNIPLQIADLYTSSLARRLNAKGSREHPKDELAEYFLDRLDVGEGEEETVGDLAVHIRL